MMTNLVNYPFPLPKTSRGPSELKKIHQLWSKSISVRCSWSRSQLCTMVMQLLQTQQSPQSPSAFSTLSGNCLHPSIDVYLGISFYYPKTWQSNAKFKSRFTFIITITIIPVTERPGPFYRGPSLFSPGSPSYPGSPPSRSFYFQ